MNSKPHLQRPSHWVFALCLLLFAGAAMAIVRVADPGGDVAASQSVTIFLPDGTTEEAETDDDGILFWLLDDGSRGAKVDKLPPGATLGGGFTFTHVKGGPGLFTPTNAIIGAVIVGGGIALASDGGSDNDPPPATDPGDGGGDGGGGSQDPDPAQLSVTPAALSINRTVGESPCPAALGSIEVSNSGEGDMSYTVSQAPDNFAHDAMPTTLSQGQMETFSVDFLCEPDEQGTVSGTLTVEGTDSASGNSAGTATVELTVNNSAAAMERGALSIDDVAHSGNHDPNSTPCNEPSFESVLSNTGGRPVNFSASSGASWVSVSPGSGTVQAGDSTTLMMRFNCGGSGFGFGQNNQTQVSITAEDDEGPVQGDGASIEVEIFVESS